MSINAFATTIGQSGSICAGCNTGRVHDDGGRPTLEPDTIIYQISFRRPGAISGYSMHLCEDCLKEMHEVLAEKVDRIKVNDVAELMIDNLEDASSYNNVNLHHVDWSRGHYAWQLDIDDLFHDGGSVRCERFFDIATDKAIDEGLEFESRAFDERTEEFIDKAVSLLRKKYPYRPADENDEEGEDEE